MIENCSFIDPSLYVETFDSDELISIHPEIDLQWLELNRWKTLPIDYTSEEFVALLKKVAGSEIENLDLAHLSKWIEPSYLDDPGVEPFLDEKIMQTLAQILPRSKIRYLNLYNNQISKNWMQLFVQGLPHSSIEELDLRHNRFEEAGTLAALAETLPYTKISRLDLSGSFFIPDEDIAYFAKILPQTQITDLDLSLMPSGLKILMEGKAIEKLEKLHLSIDIRQAPEALQSIGEAIRNSSIKEFSLRNSILCTREWVDSPPPHQIVSTAETLAAFSAFKEALIASSIEILDLGHASLSDDEAVILAELLKSSSHLRVLKLDQNSLGDRGRAALAEALPFSQLKELALGS